MNIKAITLIQPWATLVAIGAKKIETRSWSTKYRGPLAIHASAKYPKWAQEIALEIAPIHSALFFAGQPMKKLVTGCVLATCTLVDCYQITAENLPREPELSFGDYAPGRYAWVLGDIRRLPQPIPAKGALGLWSYWMGSIPS